MKTIYLVKKNPAMPKAEDNWIVMNGREFARFMDTAEGRARSLSFGRMDPCSEFDYAIVAECGANDAAQWNRDRAHSNYRLETRRCFEFLSYEMIVEDSDSGSYYKGMADPNCDIEATFVRRADWESVRIAFLQLPSKMQEILYDLIIKDNRLTWAQYAKTVGVSEETVRVRLNKAKKQLRSIYTSMYLD